MSWPAPVDTAAMLEQRKACHSQPSPKLRACYLRIMVSTESVNRVAVVAAGWLAKCPAPTRARVALILMFPSLLLLSIDLALVLLMGKLSHLRYRSGAAQPDMLPSRGYSSTVSHCVAKARPVQQQRSELPCLLRLGVSAVHNPGPNARPAGSDAAAGSRGAFERRD
jgi:hypothetical protein